MDQKIEKMRDGGKILGKVLEDLISLTKPGITELEIDKLAEELIIKKGGKPGFKRVPGYKHTICICPNDVVVHGVPGTRILKDGDVVGIDCGVFYGGFHTDMAETILVQSSKLKVKSDEKVRKFLEIGKKALFDAIGQARVGNRAGHISRTIQNLVEGAGYSVVWSLVGHGVGKNLHEKPEIPGYLSGGIEKTPELLAGMTIAIEVIYNMGKQNVVYTEGDDWTISTQDRSISGLFERTVLITEKGPQLLTRLKGDKI